MQDILFVIPGVLKILYILYYSEYSKVIHLLSVKMRFLLKL